MAGDQSSLAACSSPAARPRPAASRALSRCQWASRRALALSVAMEALGRCDAALAAGAERHDEFAGGFQRRILGIHQGDAQGAAFAQDAQAVHEIGALPGLRESEDGLPGDTQRRAVQGHHRHGQRGHRQAGVLHGQVGEVAGGMVGAAARDGQRQVRIDLPQALAKRRQAGVEHGQLTARHRGGGERFLEHQRSHSSSPSTITASSSRARSRRTTSAQAAGARRPRSARPR